LKGGKTIVEALTQDDPQESSDGSPVAEALANPLDIINPGIWEDKDEHRLETLCESFRLTNCDASPQRHHHSS